MTTSIRNNVDTTIPYLDSCYLQRFQQRKSTKSAECPGDDVTTGDNERPFTRLPAPPWSLLKDAEQRPGGSGCLYCSGWLEHHHWNTTGDARENQTTVFPKVPSLTTYHVCIMQCRRAVIPFDLVNQQLLCHGLRQALERKHRVSILAGYNF